ncbi:DUF1800 family protein [Caenimonas koreensis]|uniref:DUF1800 domain-containing protein n=1 Tax=Caenimonas koreensis TaxID=367474 RepID=UPI00378516E8
MRERSYSLAAPALAAALVAGVLAGCGAGASAPPAASTALPSPSSGQVNNTPAASGMTRFAAARVADQVSFGATPALVDALAQQGLNAWITAQMALPVTQMNPPAYVRDYDTNNQQQASAAYNWPANDLLDKALAGNDQLRQRVTWSLLQFIPVNGKVNPYAMVQYYNLLQRNAFGNYGTFIRELTINPAMAVFLDNASNRPTSDQCPSCAPNENYARELMQLFTLGVVQLNADGSVKRNAQNKPIETYSQEDVEQLAGALTGWRFAPSVTPLPSTDWSNAAVPMVPEDWAPLHDRSAKTILGTPFAANRSAPQDLDAVVTLLMAHPNIGPFVSQRLIQNLVTSNPTPAYVGRVAAVFRNNGSGVAGDMKAVIRAILTDVEARRGDVPGADTTRFGKFREPMLWYTGMLRGLGCTKNLVSPQWGPVAASSQRPFNAASVFGFYLPTDRAPGSNLLAPEQKIINAAEFTDRLGSIGWNIADGAANGANCQTDALGQAYSQSPRALIDEINARWFRGAMPPTLRTNLQLLATTQQFGNDANQAALVLTQYALTTPFYGIMK